MPVPSAAGRPWEGMDWRDEGSPEWRESLTDEQADEWRNWQYESGVEAGGGSPDGGAEPSDDEGEYKPPTDPAYQPGTGGPDATSWDYDSLPEPQAAAPAAPEPEPPSEPPDATGKPWEGMDPLGDFSNDFRLSLSDAEADEFYEWRNWHEQKAEQDTDAQIDRDNEENNARIRREIEEEQRTGEIDQYRLEHGAPAPPGKTVAFVDDEGNPLDALVKDQPVRIEVTVPRREGETPPSTIEVAVSGPRLTFIGREYTGVDSVTLEWIGNVNGPAIYRSGTLSIENGGAGVSSLGVAGFEFNTGGGMGGFSVSDGDFIQVSVEGANTGVQVFKSVAKLEIALTLTAINTAHQSYTNVLINLDSLIEQVKAAPESTEKADLLKQLTFTRDRAQQVVTLANKAIWHFNNVDILDHQHLAVLRLYAKWMGLFREPTVGADGKQTTEFGPLFVPDPREEDDFVQDESNAAKEEVRRIFWAGLTQATIGGYRLLAQATMVAQIMTIFGTNEMGQRASTMERWMAFFDLLSQAALMGAMMKWNVSMATGKGLPGGVVPRTTGRIPRTTRVADPKVAAKSPTGTPVAPEAAGMLRHAARDAQLTMRKHDAVAQVRFTNPEALGPRAMGWKPKPPDIKSQTITPIDREIGAPDGALDAAAGLFEPRMPQRTTQTDVEWAKIEARFNQRQGEWEGAIGQFQRKLVEQGKYQLRDGMMCDKDGTPITGDYDLFEITNRDGTPVSAEKYDAVVADLMSAPGFQAAHGAHMRWNPKLTDDAYHWDMSPDSQVAFGALEKWMADRSIFRDIRGKHQPGGEGLITFAPNQSPVITYAGEAVGPKFSDLGITPVPTVTTTGPNVFVRPTLFVATTDQLLAGRYPDGAQWDWTRGTDWAAEVATFTERANAFDPSRFTGTPAVPAAAAPITVQPAADGSDGRNWRPIVIGGALVGTLIVAVGGGTMFLFNQNNAVPPISVATSTPGLERPTQPTSAPTEPPTEPPTQPPTEPPTAPPSGDLVVAAIDNVIGEFSGGRLAPFGDWSEGVNYVVDSSDDLYLPNDGSPATAIQPWVDLTGVYAFGVNMTAADATAMSANPCAGSFESAGGLTFNTACNQSVPLPAGEYLVVVTTWAEQMPDPFPDLAQCTFSVQSDLDNDTSTGFQSGLPFNYLIGSDVYYENLVFVSNTGEYRNYVLATDHSLPPRSDTGEIHGNKPFSGRVIWGGTLAPDPEWTQAFLIPVDEIGDEFSVGGFCATDRGAMGPDTLAVDAAGHPGDEDFPYAFGLADLLFPPRDQ